MSVNFINSNKITNYPNEELIVVYASFNLKIIRDNKVLLKLQN